MARQGTGRRFRLLYGIAATGAFLFALPVAAWAITAAQCTGGRRLCIDQRLRRRRVLRSNDHWWVQFQPRRPDDVTLGANGG